MNMQSSLAQTAVIAKTNAFIRSVYNWMAVGLALTGSIAYFVSTNETLINLIYGNPMVIFGLIILELGFVFYLSARIQKLQAGTATALFAIYAALNGVTLSFIFLVYAKSSIVSTFFIAASVFLACSVYGMVTKRDLTSLGGFMMMGLIGIIIASVVNMFVVSPGFSKIIAYIGVFVFIGLTAYDTQKLKEMAVTLPDNATGAMVRKGAIMGALSLYLDFINLFLFLLRIFGGSRD